MFERVAVVVTEAAESTPAFALALLIVLGWAIAGPIFRFSDTWQLVINTGTTIVTFLMVFLIQRTQNKDSRALHLKLNELIAGMQGARSRLINVEDFTEAEVQALHTLYQSLARRAEGEPSPTLSHSIEEARPSATPAATGSL